ncbi:MAG: double-strand break repair protein AddB [Candidatus Puniceispirillales bacterium]
MASSVQSCEFSKICYIPAGSRFADDLVAGFMTLVDDPAMMASATILLPNRRLTQAVRMAFLRHAKGKAQLLPRLVPIGDIEEDASDLVLAGWDSGHLPPVINPLDRQFQLAHLVHHFHHQTGSDSITQAEAFGLARALGDFLDQMQTNGLSFDDLSGLVPDELAHHWQNIVSFLMILTDKWPEVLAEKQQSDAAIWRDAAIRARAKAWATQMPDDLIIIAGSTGSVPATQELMKAVIGLPNGYIVLPGFDAAIDTDEWDHLTQDSDQMVSAHPQFQMARLLHHLRIERNMVMPWPRADDINTADSKGRIRLLREVMRLSHQTHRWYDLRKNPVPISAIDGMQLMVCRDRRVEARAIALAMREALEVPAKTATLITADQELGDLVSAELSRWGIHVPSSAGTRLSDTRSAGFLRLLADAWADQFAPVSLLALTQHPLCCGGMEKSQFREMMRKIELKVIRRREKGYQGGGLENLKTLAEQVDPSFGEFINRHLITPCRALMDIGTSMGQDKARFTDIADAHAQAAEALSYDGTTPYQVWQGRAGNRLAHLFHGISDYASDIMVDKADYAVLLHELTMGQTIYPEEDLHPRLAIMGLVEARMQASDLMILGGMNEGTTPPQPQADPWMSQHMRAWIGLPTMFWRTGMAAHDVMMTMASPQILMTRSMLDAGTPTEPSRWWRRLQAVLKASQIPFPEHLTYATLDRNRHQQYAPAIITSPPRPAPVISMTERQKYMSQFSATQMETLMRDPYAIYARRVLGLKALYPIMDMPDPAMKGTIFHRAIDEFMTQYPESALPDDALHQLKNIGEKHLNVLEQTPWIKLFWQLRFNRIAEWFVDYENQHRNMIQKSVSETKGKAGFDIGGHHITLTAEADRIDLMADGSIHIVDYKTGRIPNQEQVISGINGQLIIEAMIAQKQGFVDIDICPTAISLSYWKLSGTASKPVEINARPGKNKTIEDIIPNIEAQLINVMQQDWGFASELVAHPILQYSDYRHLARVREWSISSMDMEDADD